jgi:adenylate cyclase
MLVAMCERLSDRGVPIDRVSLHVSTLHPQLRGKRIVWQKGEVTPIETPYGYENSIDEAHHRSPLRIVHQTGATVRRRLSGSPADLDFPILADLIREGMTDYVAAPLVFSTEPLQVVTWASRRAAGFGDLELNVFRGLLPALGAAVEAHEVRRMARTVLETYLGQQAGGRVLNGTIRRGDGETLAAALWYCDLRDFTAISDALPRDEIIALLNDYFECIAGPVHDRGGEILKFIGDALLAILPIADDLDRDRACRTALAAAEEALADLARLNSRRRAEGKSAIEVGIGLHTGAVMDGNIGAPNRLDFTIIGPAVNLVTRIEGLCQALG